MVQRQPREDGVEAWVSETGAIELERPEPAVLVARFRDHLTEDFAPALMTALDDVLATEEHLTVFVYADALQSYDTGLRLQMTNWIRRRRHRLAGVHLVYASQVIALAVALVNLAVGGLLRGYDDRAAFDAALAAAVRAARARHASHP